MNRGMGAYHEIADDMLPVFYRADLHAGQITGIVFPQEGHCNAVLLVREYSFHVLAGSYHFPLNSRITCGGFLEL